MRKSKIVEWTKDFSLNNKKLDSQHKIIFDMCNTTNDLAHKLEHHPNNETYLEELKQTALRLFKYIKIHFKDEEEFMKSIDFPLIEEHKKSHRQLMHKTKNIFQSHSNDAKTLVKKLLYLIKHWILNHFLHDDMWISNYIHKAIHLNEIHYTLPMYIKLKSIEKDFSLEQNFNYICTCTLKIHKIPQSIHKELRYKNTVLKCESCEQILVHFENKPLVENYDILNKQYASFAELL
ncbi:hemerythrin domain-containing protein [Campylobacter sp. MIT 21-1685]|uniref:hemerythrin family protein n=1 Tax=unclassified Campylobacter TaxID=2593542 RepID=UPI00224A63A9|nr:MULTISPECIES: hemerythrin domain-containing protein [unclassified Campylobacter]MCX2683074.1 hemerythrin domain-containing protein [Campylobacter sp. MIT 21-1684]MCX2751356.1 hemerythrin domain-containing protein [Campylobacter sp. MIT 21-1682]MCX2807555.1 hemerythrin domain-containing protein [Campylobacter sp. MIT 21-1685]